MPASRRVRSAWLGHVLHLVALMRQVKFDAFNEGGNRRYGMISRLKRQ
jgi:hypothetical protein